jgi:hypothetical protein
MKAWKKYEEKPVPVITLFPPAKEYVEEKKEEIKKSPFALECISCAGEARMLFEGTSYCRECIKQQMRTGIFRRFYA